MAGHVRATRCLSSTWPLCIDVAYVSFRQLRTFSVATMLLSIAVSSTPSAAPTPPPPQQIGDAELTVEQHDLPVDIGNTVGHATYGHS